LTDLGPGNAEVVVDASVLSKWIKPEGESHLEAAERLRAQFNRGALLIVVPPLVFLEVLNAAAWRWAWSASRIHNLAVELERLMFHVQQPPLERVAYWASQGLTAYDACYVALAEARRTVVVTDDAQMISIGGPHVRALA